MSSDQPMGTLSEWLRIMLGEVARKQDDAARAVAEQRLRQGAGAGAPKSTPGKPA